MVLFTDVNSMALYW